MAGLLQLSFNSCTPSYEPLLSRRYALLVVGKYQIEVEVVAELSAVRVRLHNAGSGAVAFLNQVGTREGIVAIFYNRPFTYMQLAVVVRDVLETYFMSLQFELLVPFDATTFVQVREALQERYWC